MKRNEEGKMQRGMGQYELLKSKVFPKHMDMRAEMKIGIMREVEKAKQDCNIADTELKWMEEETEKYINLGKEYEKLVHKSKELLYKQMHRCQKLLEPIAIMIDSFVDRKSVV